MVIVLCVVVVVFSILENIIGTYFYLKHKIISFFVYIA